MCEDTINPVYKLMTDKLQLVLINVLIRSIFEQSFKGLMGSVIINLLHNHCWVQRWKNFKIGQHLPKLWTRILFLWLRVLAVSKTSLKLLKTFLFTKNFTHNYQTADARKFGRICLDSVFSATEINSNFKQTSNDHLDVRMLPESHQ